MDIFTFVEAFRTKLWSFTSNMFILVAIITIISTLVVWFITESIEKIFVKRSLNKIIKWSISIIVVFGVTYLLIMLYQQLKINLTSIYYMLLIGIFSLSTTMLVYLKGVKILFRLIDTLVVKVDTLMINEQEDKVEAQNNLLSRKIIRDQLIVKKELEDEKGN